MEEQECVNCPECLMEAGQFDHELMEKTNVM